MSHRVIVVATSSKARGGINSVIKAYSQTEFWSDWQCFWLETHTDKNIVLKIWFFIRSLLLFVIKIPFYSIVHIHLSEPTSAFRKSIYLNIAKLFNKIIIAHFHSFSTKSTIDGRFKNLYHRFFLSSDKIIVLSDQWKSWIIQKWPELSEKIEVLYNPCPLLKLDYHHVKTKTILYAGALNMRKGYADLIKSFAIIANRNKEWKLVFAGNGEIEKAKNLVVELNIQNQVVFKGWVSGNEKDVIFQNASIFCLPSYAEGFPMAVLEAWAYGIPVITTLVGGLPDIVIDGGNALVIKPGDLMGISIATEKLIGDESLRKRLSEESLKLSKTMFSLKDITGQLDTIYTKLLNKE
jgi:glycosyltransferase involved in cell wall biosynthesis